MLLLSVYIIILTDQPHREEDQNMDDYTDVEDAGKLYIYYISYYSLYIAVSWLPFNKASQEHLVFASSLIQLYTVKFESSFISY
jgi:hypothetical protein